jgi:hypothetical protein
MYNLEKLTSVAHTHIAIQNAKRRRTEYLYRKNRELGNINDAVSNYSKNVEDLFSTNVEIQGYEIQLQAVPPPTNAAELTISLEEARTEQARIMKEIEDNSIPKTQHRRLLVALEDICISNTDILISELEAHKAQLSGAA